MELSIMTSLFGLAISIIGYFLKQTMDDLKVTMKQTNDNTNKLSLVELDYLNKHSNLNEKFDNLNASVKELTFEIKALNREIQKKI